MYNGADGVETALSFSQSLFLLILALIRIGTTPMVYCESAVNDAHRT